MSPKMDTLMRMQSAFDIFQTRQRAPKIKVSAVSASRGAAGSRRTMLD